MDSALWGTEMNQRAQKWFTQISKTWIGGDTVGYRGRVCERQGAGSAAHSPDDTPGRHDDGGIDSIHRKAVALRATLTPVNFARRPEGQQGSWIGEPWW